MTELINKPRVFLFHSKKNVDFIENLANELRRCQIEPWLDADQIRHGKSWQDSIFEYGLPTCDAIIVYFTDISIKSAVVKKEMDVGLLQNLRDNNIAFLPYVSNEKLREELRPDIQALQVPTWNNENFYQLLPRVVAEIWRSYLERLIASATQSERLKRIEAELELSKYKNQPEGIFSLSENKEFEYIWSTLDKRVKYYQRGYVKKEKEVGDYFYQEISAHKLNLQLASIFSILNELFSVDFDMDVLNKALRNKAQKFLEFSNELSSGRYAEENESIITNELLTHGLIENHAIVLRGGSPDTILQWTNKYFRLRYWLAYNNKLPNRVVFENIG